MRLNFKFYFKVAAVAVGCRVKVLRHPSGLTRSSREDSLFLWVASFVVVSLPRWAVLLTSVLYQQCVVGHRTVSKDLLDKRWDCLVLPWHPETSIFSEGAALDKVLIIISTRSGRWMDITVSE